MKIHSDVLNAARIEACLADVKRAGLVDKTLRLELLAVGSRQRRHAWDCGLYFTGQKRPGDGRRRPQGKSDGWAAFYDERGWFIARLYTLDRQAIIGAYRYAEHFHAMTDNRFAGSVAQHVALPSGAARWYRDTSDARLRFQLTGERMTREAAEARLAEECELLEWWAGQAKRARSRSAS
jgi:hypothetical protein